MCDVKKIGSCDDTLRVMLLDAKSTFESYLLLNQGPVVQSIVSLTSSLRVISLVSRVNTQCSDIFC